MRHLESELAQFTDDDEFPRNTEDMVRPGGLVKLDEHDETPRYLGPSSGIAMTRLVMEDAKRFTEAKKISDVIPSVGSRRIDRSNRMQSIVSYGGSISGPSIRKKSYPMVSAHAARELPSRPMANKLLEVYIQRGECAHAKMCVYGVPRSRTNIPRSLQVKFSFQPFTRLYLQKTWTRFIMETKTRTKTLLFGWSWQSAFKSWSCNMQV